MSVYAQDCAAKDSEQANVVCALRYSMCAQKSGLVRFATDNSRGNGAPTTMKTKRSNQMKKKKEERRKTHTQFLF